MSANERPVTVDLGDSQTTFTLRELCERSDVHAEFVIKLVNYGIIAPTEDSEPRHWQFDLPALARLRKAQRLRRDLKIDLPGLALSLDLLDELHQMRRDVDRLSRQLQHFLSD